MRRREAPVCSLMPRLRYEFSFLERLLEACNAEDITNAVRIVVERIQTRSAPRRMKFGAMVGYGATA